MEISLKKASQVLTHTQRYITELQSQLKLQYRATLVRTAQDPVQLFHQRIQAFEQQEQLIQQLNQLYFQLRGLLAQANQQAGIPALLTQQAFINAEIRRITPLCQHQQLALSDDEFQALWNSRLQQLEAGNSAGYYSAHLDFDLLTGTRRQQLQQRLQQLRRELMTVTDQLNLLNVQNTLQVPAQCWTSLEQLGVV